MCYDNQLYKVKGCHNKRKNVMLNAKKSVAVTKTIIQYAGGYVPLKTKGGSRTYSSPRNPVG